MDWMNLRVTLNAWNFLTSGEPVNSSRKTLFLEFSEKYSNKRYVADRDIGEGGYEIVSGM